MISGLYANMSATPRTTTRLAHFGEAAASAALTGCQWAAALPARLRPSSVKPEQTGSRSDFLGLWHKLPRNRSVAADVRHFAALLRFVCESRMPVEASGPPEEEHAAVRSRAEASLLKPAVVQVPLA